LLGDITKVPQRFFDLILLTDVIEHLEDYFSFLRNIKERALYKIFQIPRRLLYSVNMDMVVRLLGGYRRRRRLFAGWHLQSHRLYAGRRAIPVASGVNHQG